MANGKDRIQKEGVSSGSLGELRNLGPTTRETKGGDFWSQCSYVATKFVTQAEEGLDKLLRMIQADGMVVTLVRRSECESGPGDNVGTLVYINTQGVREFELRLANVLPVDYLRVTIEGNDKDMRMRVEITDNRLLAREEIAVLDEIVGPAENGRLTLLGYPEGGRRRIYGDRFLSLGKFDRNGWPLSDDEKLGLAKRSEHVEQVGLPDGKMGWAGARQALYYNKEGRIVRVAEYFEGELESDIADYYDDDGRLAGTRNMVTGRVTDVVYHDSDDIERLGGRQFATNTTYVPNGEGCLSIDGVEILIANGRLDNGFELVWSRNTKTNKMEPRMVSRDDTEWYSFPADPTPEGFLLRTRGFSGDEFEPGVVQIPDQPRCLEFTDSAIPEPKLDEEMARFLAGLDLSGLGK